uniref:Uncharacterized protein n=1 Tax=viral metagenome TaxID=1070528 RepID=A0A6M3LFZ8_9ZZZZ
MTKDILTYLRIITIILSIICIMQVIRFMDSVYTANASRYQDVNIAAVGGTTVYDSRVPTK